MNWDALDYMVALALLSASAAAYWIATRPARSVWHHLAVMIGAGGALLLLWMQLAVGLVGDGDHPINQAMGLVLVVSAIGALLSRFRASGMRTTLLVAAGTQMVLGALGFILLPAMYFSDIFLVTAFFSGLWTASAFLFHLACLKELRP
ncbi:MAG: hypothetical protein VX501_11385 [Pseudomonadota bacterium]|nr:hypothetical protein [Pseudomonadota bacterium]